MTEKEAVMNDLASVDISFAELYDEKGVVAIPKICDGFDMSIFGFNNAILAEKFNTIIEKESELLNRLSGERTFDNEVCLDMIIDNITRKQNKLLSCKIMFFEPDFDFIELYQDLKRIQNELGMHIACREQNVLALIDDSLTMDEIVNKILSFCGVMKSASIKEENAVKSYEESLNPAKKENLSINTKQKEEKIQDNAEKKSPKSKKSSVLTIEQNALRKY